MYIPGKCLCFCPCFTSCKIILHGRNLKHNTKLIYDLQINLQLYIIMYLHLLYKKKLFYIYINTFVS